MVFFSKKQTKKQVGVVVGGADGCGRTGAPGVYVRLDDQEILDFVRKTSDLEEIYKNGMIQL